MQHRRGRRKNAPSRPKYFKILFKDNHQIKTVDSDIVVIAKSLFDKLVCVDELLNENENL